MLPVHRQVESAGDSSFSIFGQAFASSSGNGAFIQTLMRHRHDAGILTRESRLVFA